MGTDINIKVERKQGGNWIESESDRNFYDDRNYDLFSASGGIRHKGVAIATPIFFYANPPEVMRISRSYISGSFIMLTFCQVVAR